MRRREFLRKCVLSGGAVAVAPMLNFGRARLYAGSERQYSVRTIELVERSVVIDMLGLLTQDWPKLYRWHDDPSSFETADFERLRNSGITMFHPAVDLNAADPHTASVRLLNAWNGFLQAHPDKLLRISGCEDLTACRQSNRIGILLGMQNSDHFRTAADVSYFYSLGQRTSQLTYNGPNRIGYGCLERTDLGLTPFGLSVVEAMNRTGMIIDVSHAGERTTLEAFEASSRPVLITHSNCKALAAHPRCKSDEVIKTMARRNGVMGITSIRAFVSRETNVTVDDALNHFDHVARLVGPQHVGIGSDTDLEGRKLDVRGLSHVYRVYELTEGLVRRRYSDSDIEGILGGNFRRVLSSILS